MLVPIIVYVFCIQNGHLIVRKEFMESFLQVVIIELNLERRVRIIAKMYQVLTTGQILF